MMHEPRRFFAPWRVVEFEGAFRVEDAAALPLAFVYFAAGAGCRSAGAAMSRDEAERIVLNVAALPDLRARLDEVEQERDAWRAEAERLARFVA
ncbi:hypothetical protein [Methylobacterium soli]|uniref:Uncharacterized protein n=1 Tax=Methylobacterium soli TaxID=553447 RepID=A0A6L3T024_9HYPH|nr:hypothetical protein [Methylobacterium soli]KAB1079275.1 hypothetical protein F6X53_10660 [Methylobacterium soli]